MFGSWNVSEEETGNTCSQWEADELHGLWEATPQEERILLQCGLWESIYTESWGEGATFLVEMENQKAKGNRGSLGSVAEEGSQENQRLDQEGNLAPGLLRSLS